MLTSRQFLCQLWTLGQDSPHSWSGICLVHRTQEKAEGTLDDGQLVCFDTPDMFDTDRRDHCSPRGRQPDHQCLGTLGTLGNLKRPLQLLVDM